MSDMSAPALPILMQPQAAGLTLKRARALASRVSVAALIAASLAACSSLRPEPITTEEHVERGREDYKAIYSTFAPVAAPMSLPDVIARALKNNLETKLAQSEANLQERQYDLALYQMLPRLAADAGYNWRNNDNAAESESERTRQQSLEYSYSEEPNHGTADLEFSWNLLDAGVSFFQARQQGYRSLMAIERRRKAISGIVKNVQQAYWNAAAAERLLPRVDPLLARAEGILKASRKASAERLQPELQALDFQQSMLSIIGRLNHIRSELNSARVQLASLINAPDPSTLELQGFDAAPAIRNVVIDLPKLEEASLVWRPELREAAYEEKIDRQDIYKEMIKMMPGIGILGGLNYDSNKYLYNNTWGELGLRASFNLVNLIQGPKAISAARSEVEVARVHRLAISVAVLTQVNLSVQEYHSAVSEYQTAREIDDVQQKIRLASQNASLAAAQSDADLVRRELSALVSELERDRAMAQVHTALVNLYAAVGIDLVPPNADTEELSALTDHVRLAIEGWNAGQLPNLDLSSIEPAAPITETDKTAGIEKTAEADMVVEVGK